MTRISDTCATCQDDGQWLVNIFRRQYEKARDGRAMFPPFEDWMRRGFLNCADPVMARILLEKAAALNR